MGRQWPLGAILLSGREVQALLGVEPATLRQWASRGHVAKPGRDSYDMGSVLRYLDRRGEMPPALQFA